VLSSINLSISIPWQVTTPVVFRYLPRAFVDAFFATGALRLSSFRRFHQHADEQRNDGEEGRSLFVNRTSAGGGQTLLAQMHHGHNALVLCGSLLADRDLMTSFGCDSYIRIDNPTGFGMAVARQLAGVLAGVEGACLYLPLQAVARDLGELDIETLKDPSTNELDGAKLQQFANDHIGHLPLFLKHESSSGRSSIASFGRWIEKRLSSSTWPCRRLASSAWVLVISQWRRPILARRSPNESLHLARSC